MKVLFFSHQAEFLYGGEICTLALLKELGAQGIEAHFASPEGPYQKRAREFASCHLVPSRQFSRRWWQLPGLVFALASTHRSLAALIRREKIDLLHATSLKAMVYAWCLGRHHPVIWHHHDILPAGRINNWWLRRLAARARVILAPSAATRKALLEAGVPAEKCLVLPNGFRPKDWRPRPVRETAARFNVALLGEISPRKGTDRLAGILAAWRQRGGADGVTVSVVGEGLSHPEFAAEMKSVLRGEPVAFLGRREDIQQILQGVDALLVPSRQDPLPTVIVEAFLSGVPVVGSRAGGIPEMVQEGVNGYLADSDEEYADALAFCRDPRQWRQLSAGARATAEKSYDITKITARLKEIYVAALR